MIKKKKMSFFGEILVPRTKNEQYPFEQFQWFRVHKQKFNTLYYHIKVDLTIFVAQNFFIVYLMVKAP